jgi:alkanesulfonate monooxygenase SsuD/methylene tetrahydromethanopterin reductase-like flavin-dependent oxidoreductase (luciferase family)
MNERGARLSESIEVMRELWSGESASYDGKFFKFSEVRMTPPPRQKNGPPIWCGGRKDAAFRRMGRLADGYVSYVVTPEMYREALIKIEQAANEAKRNIKNFGTGHLIFTRVDYNYEIALETATKSLSKRYAMDFRRAAERYAALGSPEDVAAKIIEFHDVGVRHIIIDLVGPYENRMQQIERFSSEVMPLLTALR